MSTVRVSNVRKAFGEVQAVDDVSFDVEAGEIFGMLGPNGAGKTTTIRMMLDIFKPDEGEIRIFGEEMQEAFKNRIGYLPEERGLYKEQKLESTLVFLATLKGMEEREAHERVQKYLRQLDLFDFRNSKIQELSRGMQQKAQVIATLVHDPELLIVDEPFSGLDPVNTRLIKQMIEEEREAGKTIIMSTHQMHQVEALCDRIMLINKGRRVLYGPVEKIKHDFSGNAVVLEGHGNFEDLPGVLEVRRENGDYRLSLQGGVDPQEVLKALVSRDGNKIERFEIAEPSLDDIFVSVVEGEEEVEA